MKIDLLIEYFEGIKSGINPKKEPGFSSAIVQNGKMVYSLNHGLSNLENEAPLTNDSLYYLASVSKQFTAACILNLVGDKNLSLGQDVREIVKETSHFTKKITIQNLLNHTSGIPDYFQYFDCQLGRYPSDFFDNEDILKVIRNFYSLKFSPNEKFEYSNSNYILLAQVVKIVSGVRLSKYAKRVIFKPLGMKQTLYDDDLCRVIKNRVCSYYTSSSTKSRVYRRYLKNSCTVGDGGVLSSINDLVNWEINFHNNKLLPTKVIKGLTKSLKLTNDQSTSYANGLMLSSKENEYQFNHHTGGFEGFRTHILRVPSKKLSLLYLSNYPSLNYDSDWYNKTLNMDFANSRETS